MTFTAEEIRTLTGYSERNINYMVKAYNIKFIKNGRHRLYDITDFIGFCIKRKGFVFVESLSELNIYFGLSEKEEIKVKFSSLLGFRIVS